MEDIEGVRVYMDDVIVWGTNRKEHDQRLRKVIERIDKYKLLMNWEKCRIRKNELTFVGEVLSAEGIRPSPDQVTAILNMRKPENREAIQRVLGSINYVGKFVGNLSARCQHMRSLLCKKVAWSWGPEHDVEWENVKKSII